MEKGEVDWIKETKNDDGHLSLALLNCFPFALIRARTYTHNNTLETSFPNEFLPLLLLSPPPSYHFVSLEYFHAI